MFSDLARDDVFRIETARLWLRWPKVADAPAIRRYAGDFKVARWMSVIPHPYPPEAAESFILNARAQNAEGTALEMVVTTLRNPREAIGGIGLFRRPAGLTLGYLFAPDHWGQGYATESARAMVGAAFALTAVDHLHSGANVDNARSLNVLAKVGFADAGRGEEYSEALQGTRMVAKVALSREAWLARKAAFAAKALSASGDKAAEAQ
jgi:RimJ/RimL family protein N-acetyltransferase